MGKPVGALHTAATRTGPSEEAREKRDVVHLLKCEFKM